MLNWNHFNHIFFFTPKWRYCENHFWLLLWLCQKLKMLSLVIFLIFSWRIHLLFMVLNLAFLPTICNQKLFWKMFADKFVLICTSASFSLCIFFYVAKIYFLWWTLLSITSFALSAEAIRMIATRRPLPP